mmetsp:Transcript_165215/g.292619  ORF Transcript_165215/g.292619 Transcript_165215/m.292619 type:complete len:970 (+) Transcript_165215:97-3006(+)
MLRCTMINLLLVTLMDETWGSMPATSTQHGRACVQCNYRGISLSAECGMFMAQYLWCCTKTSNGNWINSEDTAQSLNGWGRCAPPGNGLGNKLSNNMGNNMGNNIGNVNQPPPECKRPQIEKVFRDCIKLGGNKQTCESQMTSSMGSCGDSADAVEVKQIRKHVAKEDFADCKMDGRTDCASKLWEMLGESKPVDNVIAEAREKFQSAKGAAEALGDKMKDCVGDLETCKQKAMEQLGNLTGRVISAQEAAGELWKAGDKMASKWIRECVANATDANEKKDCLGSDIAKQMAAEASGRNWTDFKAIDMMKAARRSAEEKLKEIMEVCTASASSTEEKKQCRMRPDLKDKIAESMGMDESSVMDSDVLDFMEKGAQDDVLTAARTCSKAQLAKCKEEAKKIKAKATGRLESSVSDNELKRDAEKALSRAIGDKMEACLAEASVNSCRTALVKDEIQKAAFENVARVPSKDEISKLLKEGAKHKAKEIGMDCNFTAREDCMDLMKERMAKSMGKLKSQMTDHEVETLNLEGAKEAAFESAVSCARAKTDNNTATCDDPYEKFLAVRQKDKPLNAQKEEVERAKVMQEAAKAMEKDFRKVCLKKSSKSQADSCLQSFESERTAVASELFQGSDQTTKTKKMERAKMEASLEVIGEDFDACMAEAADSSGKTACLDTLRSMKSVANLAESEDELLEKHRREAVIKAAEACDTSGHAACLMQAREAAITSGMKKREFGRVKKLGEKKAAADTFAACKEAGKTDVLCIEEAKDKYLKVSGASGSSSGWDSGMVDKVKKLGKGLLENEAIQIRKKKQVEVQAETSANLCATGDHDKLITKLTSESATSNVTTVNKFKKKSCRVISAKAEYSAAGGTPAASDAEIEALADELSSGIEGDSLRRRLTTLGRELSSLTITTAYAAQGAEECAASDTGCGQTDSDLAAVAKTGTTSGVANLAPQILVSCALLAMLSVGLY